MPPKRKRDVYVAVTHTSHTLDNTGIQRVTRCLCRALEEDHPGSSFVSWNENLGMLTLLESAQTQCLSAYCGPQNTEPKTDVRVAPAWIGHLPIPRVYRRKVREAWRRRNSRFKFRKKGFLLIPEWVTGPQMLDLVRFAAQRKLRTVAVFHDAIAIDYPNLVNAKFRDNHMAYLKAMTHCDLVLANSKPSLERFQQFVEEDGEGNPIVDYVELAGEIPGTPRILEPNPMEGGIRALCVGSLDPRKNHQRLIRAFENVWERYPDMPLELVLVGGQYDPESDLSAWVESKVKEHKRLIWMGRVSDEVLAEQYAACHFTCFPSLVEGFGIPLLESLWLGRPCLCSKDGVVGDLAQRGGCVTCDVSDVDSIAENMLSMILDKDYYHRLSLEAINRDIKTWREYGLEFVKKMESHFG